MLFFTFPNSCTDTPGADNSSYTTSPVTLQNDGYKYRCIAMKEAGSATSPVFSLRVVEHTDILKTGDNSHLGLWLGLALISVAGFVVATVKRRECQE